MFTFVSVRSDPDVFEWFLSTLFDASLLETQSREFRGFFLASNLLCHSRNVTAVPT
jgi:hypothetical protein